MTTKILLVGKDLAAMRNQAVASSNLMFLAANDVMAAVTLGQQQHPDIILMDVHGAVPSLGQLRGAVGSALIVALVDPDLPTHLKKSLLESGFDDYTPRLRNAAELVRSVQGYLARGQHVRAQILVADDDPNARDLLEESLRDAGYDVLLAVDGTEALALAKRVPAMILLDVMMPGLDGREVCRRIRADSAARDVPVIFLSALDQIRDKLAALEAGGNDFISKPVDMDELLTKIRTMLQLHSARRDLRRVLKE